MPVRRVRLVTERPSSGGRHPFSPSSGRGLLPQSIRVLPRSERQCGCQSQHSARPRRTLCASRGSATAVSPYPPPCSGYRLKSRAFKEISCPASLLGPLALPSSRLGKAGKPALLSLRIVGSPLRSVPQSLRNSPRVGGRTPPNHRRSRPATAQASLPVRVTPFYLASTFSRRSPAAAYGLAPYAVCSSLPPRLPPKRQTVPYDIGLRY